MHDDRPLTPPYCAAQRRFSLSDKKPLPVSYERDDINQLCEDAKQQLSSPMNDRLRYEDPRQPLPPELSQKIEAIYGQAAKVLDFMCYQRRLDVSATVGRQTDKPSIKLIGDSTEMTFFCLFTRLMNGNDTDSHIVIPATISEDQGKFDEQHARLGFDFHVIQRGDDPISIKLQIKTTEHQTEEMAYSQDILVLSLESIAGGAGAAHKLQQAIIQEVQGDPNYDISLIQTATDRLVKAVRAHTMTLRNAYIDQTLNQTA